MRVNALASISDYDHWPPRQSPAGVRGIPSHDAASHKNNLHARFVATDDTCNTFNVNTGATRYVTPPQDANHHRVHSNAGRELFHVSYHILLATRYNLIF